MIEDRPDYHSSELPPHAAGHVVDFVLDRPAIVRAIRPHCDSEIEVSLGAEIIMTFRHRARPLTFTVYPDALALTTLAIVPQFKWSHYRSDWAILRAGKAAGLLIECDGHDFHTDPAQRAHDARKDEAALNAGFLTLRFTGSRIHRFPDRCAREVLGMIEGSWL